MPVAIELPQRVTLEVVDTEPAIEGPDRLLFLQAGDAVERRAHHGAAAYRGRHPVVVMTADGSYVERAKD